MQSNISRYNGGKFDARCDIQIYMPTQGMPLFAGMNSWEFNNKEAKCIVRLVNSALPCACWCGSYCSNERIMFTQYLLCFVVFGYNQCIVYLMHSYMPH